MSVKNKFETTLNGIAALVERLTLILLKSSNLCCIIPSCSTKVDFNPYFGPKPETNRENQKKPTASARERPRHELYRVI